ncbi:MAG: hypothetical protein HY721_33665 [Planctomycetes bacterium]|nr:hypothetical protein [Planctomycetota bacterium]
MTNSPAIVPLLVALALALPPAAAAVPFALGGPGVDPADFEVTVFASGLNYPKGMQRLPDGSILVATSDPRAGSQGFYDSTGTLRRLADADGDGIAAGPGQVLYSGLPGSLSGLRVRGPLVFVVSTAYRITILRLGPTPDAPLEYEGRVDFGLPGGWHHPPSDLEVREVPGAPGVYEVYFQLGSQANVAPSTATVSLGSDIGLEETLLGDSIYRLTVADDEGSVAPLELARIAKGLRNAAGLAFHPVTGDLYFQDNGIDGAGDPNEPLSADELNRIAAAEIGGDAVEDFGFPASYVRYRTGASVGGGGIPPLFAFQPLPVPQTGKESEGPSEIAFSPPGFPEALRRGVILGFHGKFNLGGLENEENAVVYADLAAGTYFHLIAPRQPGVGHLDGLLATEDSLYVADLSSSGSLSTGKGKGVIYVIRALRPARALFVRGDSGGDGRVDLGDAIGTLGYLFLRGAAPACLDAADANDDGDLDVSDPVATVIALFGGGPAIPPPWPEAGEDPTADGLECERVQGP